MALEAAMAAVGIPAADRGNASTVPMDHGRMAHLAVDRRCLAGGAPPLLQMAFPAPTAATRCGTRLWGGAAPTAAGVLRRTCRTMRAAEATGRWVVETASEVAAARGVAVAVTG